MENIQIVAVSPQEVLQLQQISIKTFSQTFAEINTEENMTKYLKESFSIEQLEQELNNELSYFYFAKWNDQIIAYMKLNTGEAQKEALGQKSLEIERIYVLSDFHGKKVGQVLYNKAIEVAQAKAMDFVWLGVWEKNSKAIAFYTKNGFVQFDQHVFMLGDDQQLDLLMKLNLV